MTVIAWDGETLAADKLMCAGSVKKTTTKIFRHGDELLAVAGDLSIGVELVDWYKNGAVHADYPAVNRKADSTASLMIIRADRTAWRYESGPVPFRCEGKFCAWGSGDEGALVALACGKTAIEAVELVSRFNTGCGNGVDALRLVDQGASLNAS